MIEHQCQKLVAAYCHFVDHGEAARVAELFSQDGMWIAGGVDLKGREAIADGFEKHQSNGDGMSRHVCENFLCEVLDANHAEATVYVTLYRHEPDSNGQPTAIASQTMVGEYRDAFVRTSEGWRIAKREVGVRFSAVHEPSP